MNRPEWEESLLSTEQSQTFTSSQKIITTCIILLIAYYAVPFLTYETTIKRSLHEVTLKLIPSPFIRAMQSLIFRPYTSGNAFRHPRDLLDTKAKSEAIQELYEGSGIPSVVNRARSWSGYDKFVNTSSEPSFLGLRNWDNSCFQNSILQGLSSLPAFLEYLQQSHRLCVSAGVEANTHQALKELLFQLNEVINRKSSAWPPDILKSLDTWQQQDAQEYFSRILDAIDKEAGNCRNVLTRRAHPGLNCFGIPRIYDAKIRNGAIRDIEKKLLELSPRNPIEGMLAQSLRCQKCGFSEGFSFMSFNCLTLNLGLGGNCQLEELLDGYTEPEMIEGVECDGCTKIANQQSEDPSLTSDDERQSQQDSLAKRKEKKKKIRSTKAKQITFGRLPTDLVLHINRSIFDNYGNQHKNFAPVSFPARLEIASEWCAPIDRNVDSVPAIYELKCIVTHSGRHDNGHYIACGKRGKDWYSFNDETVTKITEESVLSRGNVFMLFYERVEQGPIIEVPSMIDCKNTKDAVEPDIYQVVPDGCQDATGGGGLKTVL